MIPSGSAWRQQQESLAVVRAQLKSVQADNERLRAENVRLLSAMESQAETMTLVRELYLGSRNSAETLRSRLEYLLVRWPFVARGPDTEPTPSTQEPTLLDPTLGTGG